jgi:hypothetical protein
MPFANGVLKFTVLDPRTPVSVTNCNEALIKAEQAAGGIIAPSVIIGIGGELVKGDSTTLIF